MEKSINWFDIGVSEKWIGRHEQELVRFCESYTGGLSESARLCLVFVSLFVRAGHVCLPLDRTPKEWLHVLDIETEKPDLLPDQPVDEADLKVFLPGEGEKSLPIIRDSNKLFFKKYYNTESIVAESIKEKTSCTVEVILNKELLDFSDILFPKGSEKETDWQRVAAFMALRKKLLVISGGPGTGKTSTVGKILALLFHSDQVPASIALAAPTGKAAARMGDALQKGIAQLPVSDDIKNRIPSEAQTIHRLLNQIKHYGLLPSPHPRKLPYDLIIVDEVSMADLELMHALLDTCRDDCRIILLGDKDQLSSVEAGAVLADICRKPDNAFSEEMAAYLKEAGFSGLPVQSQSSVDDSIVYLKKSWRFGNESGIGRLAAAINNPGNSDSADSNGSAQQSLFSNSSENFTELFASAEFSDISHKVFNYDKEALIQLFQGTEQRLKECFDKSAQEILNIWQNETWLCVLRNGKFGSRMLNRLTEEYLFKTGLIRPVNGWYTGRPVMITRNDYSLGVYNGDIGVCIVVEETPVVYLQGKDGVMKEIQANRLQHVEPAYFMTVHKSQGSEFGHVHLLLPSHDTPVLSRELLYTAVTRASKRFTLHGDAKLFEVGAERKTERFTALASRLHNTD